MPNILPIVGILGIVIAIIAFMIAKHTKVKVKGSIFSKMRPRYPFYDNLEKDTYGRILGENGFDPQPHKGTANFRYSKGALSGTRADQDVPIWAVERSLGNADTPEGIFRVKPYTTNTKFTFVKPYLKRIRELEDQNKDLQANVISIKRYIMSGKLSSVSHDELERLKNLLRAIKTEEKPSETTLVQLPSEQKQQPRTQPF